MLVRLFVLLFFVALFLWCNQRAAQEKSLMSQRAQLAAVENLFKHLSNPRQQAAAWKVICFDKIRQQLSTMSVEASTLSERRRKKSWKIEKVSRDWKEAKEAFAHNSQLVWNKIYPKTICKKCMLLSYAEPNGLPTWIFFMISLFSFLVVCRGILSFLLKSFIFWWIYLRPDAAAAAGEDRARKWRVFRHSSSVKLS